MGVKLFINWNKSRNEPIEVFPMVCKIVDVCWFTLYVCKLRVGIKISFVINSLIIKTVLYLNHNKFIVINHAL